MSDTTNNWHQFALMLSGILPQIPLEQRGDAPFLDLANIHSCDLFDRLEDTERPFCDSIEAAIRAWPESPDAWTSLSGRECYFLRLRVETSLQFVLMHGLHVDQVGVSFIDFPEHFSRVEFARFLFIDWWKVSGRSNASLVILAGHHDRNRQK